LDSSIPNVNKHETATKSKESTMLRDLTNDRQLKNSETCPEQLTPGLPKVETNRAGVNTRIKNFQSKQATSQMNG